MSPFGDIRAWQRALARWSDIVEVTALAPPDDERDRARTAVGLVTVSRLSNGAFVMAKLAWLFEPTHAGATWSAAFDVNGTTIRGGDPEEVIFRLVEIARRATPPGVVFRPGPHHR